MAKNGKHKQDNAALRMLPTPAMVEKRTIHVYAALTALQFGQLDDERFNELTVFVDAFECMGRIKGGPAGQKLRDAAEAAMQPRPRCWRWPTCGTAGRRRGTSARAATNSLSWVR